MSSRGWTARSLFFESFRCLRRRPIYALPIAIADLLGFAAMHLQHALHEPLFALLLSHRDSVLGQSRQLIWTQRSATEASLLTVPLIWGCYFLNIFLYTVALRTVSEWLRIEQHGQSADLRIAMETLFHNTRAIFRFSLFLLLLSVMGAIVMWIMFAMTFHIPWLAGRMGFDLGVFFALLVESGVAFICARRVLLFLGKTNIAPSSTIIHLARTAGIVAVTTQCIFILLIRHSAPAALFQQTSIVGFLLREAIVSLIGASPYVPLFIALSLLASEDNPIMQATSPEQESKFGNAD